MLYQEINLKDGKKNGVMTEWDREGNKRSENMFVDGKLNGLSIQFHDNGQKNCEEVLKDGKGRPIELRCTYDPKTRGGSAPDGRRVKGTLHWVSKSHAVDANIRLYDRLFSHSNPLLFEDLSKALNPDSLKVLTGCKLEPSLAGANLGDCFQFERLGYFCLDPDSNLDLLVFNRTVTLRDTWARLKSQMSG